MKKIGLLSLLLSSLTSYAGDLPYSVSYQDRGAIIKHETCRLIVYNDEVKLNHNNHPIEFGIDYLDDELSEFLALKGYSVLDRTGYSTMRNWTNGFKEGDLTLKMLTLYSGKKHQHEGVLGYYTSQSLQGFSSKTFTPNIASDFKPFLSTIFKMRKNSSFSGKSIYTTKKLKGRKALTSLYDSLPDCVTIGFGHSYEEEIYNQDIALNELNSCINLYNLNIRRVAEYNIGNEKKIMRWASVKTVLLGITVPVTLPIAGGVVGYQIIRETSKKSLAKSMLDSKNFLTDIKSCYMQILRGNECTHAMKYEHGPNYTVGNLSKKAAKEVNKYLVNMTPTELTQKVTDYLGSTKACSFTVSKVKQVTLKKILNKAKKTF